MVSCRDLFYRFFVSPNPSYYPKDGDKAVTLFTQKGFTWNSQCEFVK